MPKINPMLVVCHKLAAARSVLNDGPDDSDADMAARYIAEAATIASEIVNRCVHPDGRPLTNEESMEILDMIRMKPEEVLRAYQEEAPDVG